VEVSTFESPGRTNTRVSVSSRLAEEATRLQDWTGLIRNQDIAESQIDALLESRSPHGASAGRPWN